MKTNTKVLFITVYKNLSAGVPPPAGSYPRNYENQVIIF